MVLGLVALLVAVWLLMLAKNYTASIASYRVVDDRTIAVEVVAGHQSWCRVTSVAETSAVVRTGAQCLDWLALPGTAEGVLYELTVRLSQPLGSRVVVDDQGVLVPLKQ